MNALELVPAAVLVFLSGYMVGNWQTTRYFMAHGPRQDRYFVEVAPGHLVVISEFGKLDIARARALASRIAYGRPIRSRQLVGKGKLLRRSEWDSLIAGEWRDRGWMVKDTDGTYTPSPACIAFCKRMLPPSRTHMHR